MPDQRGREDTSAPGTSTQVRAERAFNLLDVNTGALLQPELVRGFDPGVLFACAALPYPTNTPPKRIATTRTKGHVPEAAMRQPLSWVTVLVLFTLRCHEGFAANPTAPSSLSNRYNLAAIGDIVRAQVTTAHASACGHDVRSGGV